MARKTFVSSKKNAPSRAAVSSKEAALHQRSNTMGAAADDDASSVSQDEEEAPGSPMSSSDTSSDEEVEPETVPSVGKGKQLRMPLLRGKESRVTMDPAGDSSDSDSLLNVASDEEEEEEEPVKEEVSLYPIKASRVRKRHRPESKQDDHVATFVRDRLLTVRDGSGKPRVLDPAAREEFDQQLQRGEVARVRWKEVESERTEPSTSEKPAPPAPPLQEERKESNGRAKSHKQSERDKQEVDEESADVCVKCKRKVSEVEEEAVKKAKVDTVDAETNTQEVRLGRFTLQAPRDAKVETLVAESEQLMSKARHLKHEGNRKGTSDRSARLDQAKCYLHSSATFLQYALKLHDLKLTYRAKGDTRQSTKYSEMCIGTLPQTAVLVESTIHGLKGVGGGRLLALAYKLAAIIRLTLFRLQHVKLYRHHADLFTPGRSPDTRQHGTTPPISTNGDSNDAAKRSQLLKGVEHPLRGFDMWQRYEACETEVLPRITNPAVFDYGVLFDDLAMEFDAA